MTFQSSDELRSLVLTQNTFAFLNSGEYENWEAFNGEAKKLWELFQKYVNPANVIQRSIRYIDSIPIPNPLGHIEDWLSTYLTIGKGLLDTVDSYYVSYSYSFEKSNITVNVSQTIGSPESGSTPILLDFDVVELNKVPSTSEDLWAVFSELRTIKNNLFFMSITDKTLELLK